MAAIFGIPAALYAWRQIREEGLRRSEVLIWANDVIVQLESLLLTCIQTDASSPTDIDVKTKLDEIAFKTAILVEQGRLFFRNQPADEFGMDKQPAYRGIRPLILDHIVVAHQIAREWIGANQAKRVGMRAIAEDCLKKFVSLAQLEVGRSKTRSGQTAAGGEGLQLRQLLERLHEPRVK